MISKNWQFIVIIATGTGEDTILKNNTNHGMRNEGITVFVGKWLGVLVKEMHYTTAEMNVAQNSIRWNNYFPFTTL